MGFESHTQLVNKLMKGQSFIYKIDVSLKREGYSEGGKILTLKITTRRE